jgi:hypothetical protein
MPFRTIPGEETRYGLITFRPDGAERLDDPEGGMSERLLDIARDDGITNVFVFTHGWMGDVPAAIDQYDRWIRAFDSSSASRQRAAEVFSGFRPLFIGLHWPSLPWGDEEIANASFAPLDAPDPAELYRLYLDRLGDGPEVRSALRAILGEARHATAHQLSDRAREAFLNLNDALGFSRMAWPAPPTQTGKRSIQIVCSSTRTSPSVPAATCFKVFSDSCACVRTGR